LTGAEWILPGQSPGFLFMRPVFQITPVRAQRRPIGDTFTAPQPVVDSTIGFSVGCWLRAFAALKEMLQLFPIPMSATFHQQANRISPHFWSAVSGLNQFETF